MDGTEPDRGRSATTIGRRVKKLLAKFLSDRLDPDDGAVDEAARDQELRSTLVKHRLTLQAVDRVLSDSQQRVAVAINETGDAIAKTRRARKR